MSVPTAPSPRALALHNRAVARCAQSCGRAEVHCQVKRSDAFVLFHLCLRFDPNAACGYDHTRAQLLTCWLRPVLRATLPHNLHSHLFAYRSTHATTSPLGRCRLLHATTASGGRPIPRAVTF